MKENGSIVSFEQIAQFGVLNNRTSEQLEVLIRIALGNGSDHDLICAQSFASTLFVDNEMVPVIKDHLITKGSLLVEKDNPFLLN